MSLERFKSLYMSFIPLLSPCQLHLDDEVVTIESISVLLTKTFYRYSLLSHTKIDPQPQGQTICGTYFSWYAKSPLKFGFRKSLTASVAYSLTAK